MATNPTLELNVQALANYLPNSDLFEGKNIDGSNFRDMLEGLAGEFFRAQGYLVTFENDYYPDDTELLLSNWERAFGIPDLCFSGTGTLEERQRDLIVKIASLGVQTNQDFIDLADLFGITVAITAFEDPPLTFEVEFTTAPSAVFPLTFPFTFGGDTIAILNCLFTNLRPSNSRIIFTEV